MLGTSAEQTGRWFRVAKAESKPCVRLVCFPHAGGTASFFRTWAPFVPTGVELAAVCYPGREERIVEPFAETMEELVGPLAHACHGLLDVPLAFFGHSMGVLVAYEVALRLQEECGAVLAALFVSGSAAPGWNASPKLSGANDNELIEDVLKLGGMDPRVIENSELRDLILVLFVRTTGLSSGMSRGKDLLSILPFSILPSSLTTEKQTLVWVPIP
jgi:pyochelin biosynthetic protein PchC